MLAKSLENLKRNPNVVLWCTRVNIPLILVRCESWIENVTIASLLYLLSRWVLTGQEQCTLPTYTNFLKIIPFLVTWLNKHKFMQRYATSYVQMKLIVWWNWLAKSHWVLHQHSAWMQPLIKCASSSDISYHWREFHSAEICVFSIGKKLTSVLDKPNTFLFIEGHCEI